MLRRTFKVLLLLGAVLAISARADSVRLSSASSTRLEPKLTRLLQIPLADTASVSQLLGVEKFQQVEGNHVKTDMYLGVSTLPPFRGATITYVPAPSLGKWTSVSIKWPNGQDCVAQTEVLQLTSRLRMPLSDVTAIDEPVGDSTFSGTSVLTAETIEVTSTFRLGCVTYLRISKQPRK